DDRGRRARHRRGARRGRRGGALDESAYGAANVVPRRRASGRRGDAVADGPLLSPGRGDFSPPGPSPLPAGSSGHFALLAEPSSPWADVTFANDELEAKLIERLVARDERAFNELVQVYGRRVSALVLRMLGSPTEAEDLTQEVFVQVFKAIGSFRGESK